MFYTHEENQKESVKMTKFINYSSIENSYRQKEINTIRELGFHKVEWVATEKVHGANFSLWNIDGQVVPGKRSGFADGSFYGCQSIVESLTPKVKAVGMTIFGEIFGHGVQKGVNYGPKRFAAFDILDGEKYINYDKFVELCNTNGIDRCVEIARGSFEDLLQIDATFVTKMSVNETTDIAEGFVMKPVDDLYYPNGSRVILKKKTEKFQEKCTGPKPKIDITLTDSQQSLLNLAASYVNQERVESAISKYGEDVKFPTVLGEVLKDIHGELLKDEEVDISTWNSINKQVCSLISPIIRAKLFGGFTAT